mgnify:CR=1 FL=1
MRKMYLFPLALCFVFCLCARAEAHKVYIFAYVDGNKIFTSSGYSKKNRVQNGTLEVQDAASGKVLLTGTTDVKGDFNFDIPEEARAGHLDLNLVILAGEGHRAVWKLPYAEYAADATVENSAEPAVETAVGDAGETVDVSDQRLERLVRRAVHSEVSGLKRMIAEMHDEDPGIKEVIAGIGYLIGIAGLLAYVRSRRFKG